MRRVGTGSTRCEIAAATSPRPTGQARSPVCGRATRAASNHKILGRAIPVAERHASGAAHLGLRVSPLCVCHVTVHTVIMQSPSCTGFSTALYADNWSREGGTVETGHAIEEIP